MVVDAQALHGDVSQAIRESILADFRSGKFSTLVTTDVAARGIDVANVDIVLQYTV
jgi:ATP-dependent RNA helicase DDX21